MSKRGYYLGGSTVISGRNRSWFSRDKKKAKVRAQAEAKEKKRRELEAKWRISEIRKAEYDSFLRATDQGGVLIKAKPISKKGRRARRPKGSPNVPKELSAIVPDQTAVVQSLRGRRRVVPVVIRRKPKALQQKSR